MTTAWELIEKQENYYKELQRLSDPNSYFEDHPDSKEVFEDVYNALPELYTDPSLLKNYDSDFIEELLFLVVYLPLSRMDDFYMGEKGLPNIGNETYDEEDEALVRLLRSKLGSPNSKEMFRVLKEAKKPFDRDFYFKTVENPSILYRLQCSVERDDFDSFDTLILEHFNELKLFFFCMLFFPLIASFRSAMYSLSVDDSEEAEQKALALLTSGSDFVERLDVLPEPMRRFLRKMKDMLANMIKVVAADDDDSLRQLTIAYLRYFAYMSSTFKFDEREKAIFDRVLYNPFFPDLYTNCLKEVEAEIEREKTQKELPEEQEQPEVQPGEQKPSVDEKLGGWPGSDKKTPGREPEKWFKGNWSEEEFTAIIESKIYPFLKGELNDFVFDDETSKSETKKQAAINAAAAAIILYSSEIIKLPQKTPITTCSVSMSRTLSAPKSSVSVYLKALIQWYPILLEISKDVKRSKEALTIVEGWKRTDLIRGTFIGHNFKTLRILINNTAFLMGQALEIKTNLVYKATGGAYDRALYKSTEYDENIQTDENGHRHNTARKMSDGDED